MSTKLTFTGQKEVTKPYKQYLYRYQVSDELREEIEKEVRKLYPREKIEIGPINVIITKE